MEDFSEFTRFAQKIGKMSGDILMKYCKKEDLKFETKGFNDIATEADKASEKAIVEAIQKQYPDHSILAEESGKHDKSSKYRWIIDPLDGTTNFKHKLPIFSVSIGLEIDGEIHCGVVYNPCIDEFFTAEKGKGAYLNNEKIHVSDQDKTELSIHTTGFSPNVDLTEKNIKVFSHLVKEGLILRRFGSAAIDLCYTACGRFDSFWEFNLFPWDIAAGILIVEEAGGKVTAIGGNPLDIYARESILASNGKLHDKMNETIMDALK